MRGTELEARRSYLSWGDNLKRRARTVGKVGLPSELRLGSLRGTEGDGRPGAFDLALLALSVVATLLGTSMLVGGEVAKRRSGVELGWTYGFESRGVWAFPVVVVALVAASWTSTLMAGLLLWRPVRSDVPRLALLLFTPIPLLLFVASGWSGSTLEGGPFHATDTYDTLLWLTEFAPGSLLLGLVPIAVAWVLLEQLPSVVTSPAHRWALRVCLVAWSAVVMRVGFPFAQRFPWWWSESGPVLAVLLWAAAGCIVVVLVRGHRQLSRSLRWTLLLVGPLLLTWIGVAALEVYNVTAETDGPTPILNFGPGDGPFWKYASVAVAVVALPVYAAVVLVHDYLIVGRVLRLPAATAGGSPAELEDGLRLALGDPDMRLLFASADSERLMDVSGRSVARPALHASRLQELAVPTGRMGLLVWSRDSRPDPVRLSVLMCVLAVPLARARMQLGVLSRVIDLTDSRRRMLEAETAARRQIERDLHDGAQQRLTVSLMLLRNSATAADPEEMMRRASEHVEAALREIQSLARGLHSATLASSGLAAAVEELAESLPFPVEVRVVDVRFPQLVEVTAYLVIKECLTNVVKYADATQVSVATEVAGGALLLRVEDDGCGGADPDVGTGLVGLSDRVGALGGSVQVDSPIGDGTRVDVVIPLAQVPALQPLGS